VLSVCAALQSVAGNEENHQIFFYFWGKYNTIMSGSYLFMSNKNKQLYIQSHHITNNWFQSKIAVNTTRYNNWFTTNRSCRNLPSHRTYTHTPKPNKLVDPQLATSQQLQLHATHTKNC
jgi:hypothetical protein